mmetsp:Transcript_16281/g.53047  ORF Transcript_16281/g.53047 Transcript_16281/m.53047 type:complete len:203 (-) Transcript_16281:1067-1675(-)
MSPKSLLRHKLVKSDIEDFAVGSRFHRYLPDASPALKAPDQIRKLVLCTGKVYYDVLAEREKRGVTDVAIGRLEQISPFPHDHLLEEAKKYPNAEIVWCQEEQKNMGAWTYVRPRISTAMKEVRDVKPVYAGRAAAAATASVRRPQGASGPDLCGRRLQLGRPPLVCSEQPSAEPRDDGDTRCGVAAGAPTERAPRAPLRSR